MRGLASTRLQLWRVLLGRRVRRVGAAAREARRGAGPQNPVESERVHYVRVRRLRAPTAKLVYLFLRDHQPQSLATIRHTLGISKSAGQDALEELRVAGFVVQDEEYLYWLAGEGKRVG